MRTTGVGGERTKVYISSKGNEQEEKWWRKMIGTKKMVGE